MNKTKLTIMEIERFAIHDGEGIRTTVFLKGCPLHCHWCANPESQKLDTLLMYYRKKCSGCGSCVSACQNEAIKWQENRPVFIRDKCRACEECQKVCLSEAIAFSGKVMKIDDIMAEVLRDKEYYDISGGGITLSGGEPFSQFDGALQLLKKSKENNLNTAVETSGYTKTENLQEVLPFVGSFLFDIKHVDAEKFKLFTGGELSIVLENLRWLASVEPQKILPRIPIIPNFNHSKEEVTAIFSFLKNIGLTKVCLLPYHALGSDKYEQLGLINPYDEVGSLQGETFSEYIEIGVQNGLEVQVGA